MKDLTLKFDSQHFIDSLIKLKNSNWKNKFDFIERPYTIPSIGLIKHPRKNVSAATDGVEGWRAHTTIYSLIKKKVAKVDPGFPLWAIVYHRVNKIYRSSVSLSFSSMGENAKRWRQQHTAAAAQGLLVCYIRCCIPRRGFELLERRDLWFSLLRCFQRPARHSKSPAPHFFSFFSWPFKLFAGVPDFWCDMLLM